MDKNIVFRVDSSWQIGSGHLMRCLTLANQLKEKARIIFICRDLPGNINYLIEENGFQMLLLPREPEDSSLHGYAKWLTVTQKTDFEQTKELLLGKSVFCLVVDSYAIDVKWEEKIRPLVKKIMVIDDLANRRHDCDILLDQSYYEEPEKRYKNLVPNNCLLLLGVKYLLLREEFYQTRKTVLKRYESIKNIFVFLGGSDSNGTTMKVLNTLDCFSDKKFTVNVVVGKSNVHLKEISLFCNERSKYNYFLQVNNLAQLMSEADIAIGAGGLTMWERCFLGLPSLVIALAENQVDNCKLFEEKGFIKYLGMENKLTQKDIYEGFVKFLSDSDMLSKMREKSLSLVSKHERNLAKYILENI